MASIRGPIPQVTETPPPELKVETALQNDDGSDANGHLNHANGAVNPASRSPAPVSSNTLSPTPPSHTPREASPERLSPLSSHPRLHGAFKKHISRSPHQMTSGHSPLRMSPEDADSDHNINGTRTPPRGRKGVQFSQEPDEVDSPTDGNDTSAAEGEKSDSQKPQSLYSKLRALAASQGFVHTRTPSGWSLPAKSDGKELDGHLSRSSTQQDVALSATLEQGDSDADVSAEDSPADPNRARNSPRKRRRKHQRLDDIETAPSSPHSVMREGFVSAPLQPETERPLPLARRATDTDMNNMKTDKAGLSEDEGRKRLNPPSTWTPRHPLRGLSYGGQRKVSDGTPEGRESRRPLNLRNLTTITSASGHEGEETETPRTSRRRQLTERGTTLSAARWNKLKQKMQLSLGQSRKKPPTQDHIKSAQLIAELGAVAPAALMVASMFQRDEHDNRRIPVLLEQLKVKVTDTEVDRYRDPDAPTPGDRHLIFRIELEYGNGINRMKWVLKRSLRDFANLHVKYKLHYSSEKLKGRGDTSKEMPKFPRSAFPYLKNYFDFEDEGEEDIPDIQTARTPADEERPRMWGRPSFGISRRKSSIGGIIDAPVTPTAKKDNADRQRERQRKVLEDYLQRMIRFMLFRPDSNRLCKFLEVSALGMRLASEGSYHGKEGFLLIRSAKGLDFRRSLKPKNIKARHTPKWFLVRHSYVVCVNSPEEMHIYDVFLFDSDFRIQSSKQRSKDQTRAQELAEAAKESARHPQHHRLKLYNSERKLKLLARNERQLHQFEESIRMLIDTSPWVRENRFGSFAPVRKNCFAQWLVDGRDYTWVVSRALSQAKDVIYIHDWWLSPELYMRRPPAISQKWRLDRLLKRKAEEGVKVFVIVYRNVESAIPIDSQYTKFSLLDLHPNIFVQRSPNQFRQNTFFWAHHEKVCIVDHTLAFVGGIDLCFGRWDTPQHTLIDDKPTGFEPGEEPRDADHCQLWPGKDYSNPRIQDFYALNKPYEEMYDRQRVARMPWHDISMQVVGQPARDLTRHFVQRWNYILRQRKPTRPTPFLLPPPDFNPADLEALGLDGTCEVQILRSAGPWSLGTPEKTEHSIMTAYTKMIEESEHFVYMENQFFITSCETESVTVHNQIGDALVERITRASKNDETWRAIIIIPLIPGFQNTVEQEGGTSVRLIMQYQYRSICRGESSIFGRLRSLGIDPEDYIQFYSLRQWGRLGPRKSLVTEQLYIHAKTMVVDDRVAIIGSANINERSMLGNRDSECAAIVRDTDMLWSTMNGKPYQVGRFPHSLRMRLMREHLGLDVDKIMEDAQAMENERRKSETAAKNPESRPGSAWEEDDIASPLTPRGETATRETEIRKELLERSEELRSFNHDVDWEQAGNPNLKANRKLTQDHRVTGNEHHRQDVNGKGFDHMNEIEEEGLGIGRDTTLVHGDREVLVTSLDPEGHTSLTSPRKHGEIARLPTYVLKRETPNPPMPPRPALERLSTEQLGLPMLSQLPALPMMDDTDIGGPALDRPSSQGSGTHLHHPLTTELKRPFVDRDCMTDPVADSFLFETWHTVAENNTKLYRTVFRCMPDNLVRDWHEYHQYIAYEQRFNQLQGTDITDDKIPHGRDRSGSAAHSGPPGAGSTTASAAPVGGVKNLSKTASDIEKKASEAKDILHKAITNESKADLQKKEKAELRAWAAEANTAQEQRMGKPLQRQDPALDEKGLATVPEDERQGTPEREGESVVDPDPSSPTTTASVPRSVTNPFNEKAGASPAFGEGEAKHAAHANGSTNTTNVNGNASGTWGSGSARRRRRATTTRSRRDFSAADDILSVDEAEELLGLVQGHLVMWPYDWYVCFLLLLDA
jgi:phospholipase D1/2